MGISILAGNRIGLKFTDDDAFLFVVVGIIGEYRSGDGIVFN